MSFKRVVQEIVLAVMIGAGVISTLALHHRATQRVAAPSTPAYAMGIGILSGPIQPLASPRDRQDSHTIYTTNPDSLAQVLIGARYFQVTGIVSGSTYIFPWHFQRTDPRDESVVVVAFGYNAKRHTQLIATGIATGPLLKPIVGGHTASGGQVPKDVALPIRNLSNVTSGCGLRCNIPRSISYTTDVAYFDPVWIKLTEGKLNLNCTVLIASIYDCHGWWWAYWADDGWQLTSNYYSGPFALTNEERNWSEVHFEHPWFCAGQATYIDYAPQLVNIYQGGIADSDGSWDGVSGACASLISSVWYS